MSDAQFGGRREGVPQEDSSNNSFIRVGEGYQAAVPPAPAPAGYDAKTLPQRLASPRMVWSPAHCKLSSSELDAFVENARASVGHELKLDQVLGILHWNQYSVKAAMQDIKIYCLHPDLSIHWTPNEIALFERGYARHNKQFRKIAQMINGKSTKSVVRYYYHWKNTRRTDKRVQSLALDEMGLRQPVADEDGEEEQSDAAIRRMRRASSKAESRSVCGVCGGVDETVDNADGWRLRRAENAKLCNACGSFWSEWGRDRISGETRRKRPKLDFEDTMTARTLQATLALSSEKLSTELSRLQAPESDRQYLHDKKAQLGLEERLSKEFGVEFSDALIPVSSKPQRQGQREGEKRAIQKNPAWSQAEIATVVSGLGSHGRNFQRIATTLKGSKSVAELREWWTTERVGRGLDKHVTAYYDHLRSMMTSPLPAEVGEGVTVV